MVQPERPPWTATLLDGVLEAHPDLPDWMRRPRGVVRLQFTPFPIPIPADGRPHGHTEVVTGLHAFQVAHDGRGNIYAIHASPGSGTWRAEIDSSQSAGFEDPLVKLEWEPTRLTLSIVEGDEETRAVTAEGVRMPGHLYVGRGGMVFEVGGPGFDVMGFQVFDGDGEPVIRQIATDAWRETTEGLGVLMLAEVGESHLRQLEIVRTGLVLVGLNTGLEAYARTRFLELEQEGVAPDEDSLIGAFFSQTERNAGIPDEIRQTARDRGETFIQGLVRERRIDFGNYKHLGRTFRRAYGLRLGIDLGLVSQDLAEVKRLMRLRHTIAHVSVNRHVLEIAGEDPVFASDEFARDAIQTYERFVEALHQATLALDRAD